MKKIVTLALVLALAVTMLVGCGSKSVSVDWATIDAENGTLRVNLPVAEDSLYTWDVSVLDDTVAELINSAYEDGFTASFRGLADGTTSIYLNYACANHIAEVRTLDITVKGEKIKSITLAEAIELEEVLPIKMDPALINVYNANSIDNIFMDHMAARISGTTNSAIGEDEYLNLDYYLQLSYYDGYYWLSQYTGDKESEHTLYRTICHDGEGQPGAEFVYAGDLKYISPVPASYYDEYVRSYWLNYDIFSNVKLVSVEDDTANGTTTYYAYHEEESLGGTAIEYTLVVNSDNLQLQHYERLAYDIESGKIFEEVIFDIEFGDSEDVDFYAPGEVVHGNDLCELTVNFVAEVGEGAPETQTFTVVKDAHVLPVVPASEFTMYSDAERTNQIDFVDLSGDTATVYVYYTPGM